MTAPAIQQVRRECQLRPTDDPFHHPPVAIRLRRSFEREGQPKGYRKTARFVDEASGGTLYTCDIVGHVARSRVARPFFQRRGFALLAARTVVRRGMAIETFRMEKILAG